MAVRFQRVDQDRAVLAAVTFQVTLPVAVDIQASRHAPPGNRLFPDTGSHDPAAPGMVARQTNVEGY
jgi:hypothetical protein